MSRGFARAEYEARVQRIQTGMDRHGLGALLLTCEPDVRYVSGFLTRFWESPTRPWFVILPARGAPVAVIPSIGAALMATTWIADIRTWPAPVPDDDGVSLLAGTLREIGGPVGIPSHLETHLRMPLDDFHRLKEMTGLAFIHDHGILANARAVKSPAELTKIETICAIAGRAFARVNEIADEGVPLSQTFRDFQRLLLEEGADWVPYLAGGAGPDGYGDVISPATDAPLAPGDLLMLDTGAVYDGYFCDFDRNFAVGAASETAKSAYKRLLAAAEAGREVLCPGSRACDAWRAMARQVGDADTAGRLGHGLGMQLTEGLSLTEADTTVLTPGMVVTLEPGLDMPSGRIMVHEDVFVITETGARQISPPAPSDLPII
ncbi:M24 family metallopeptidase [Roseovarius aestuariivivens]|uniref:M24 family metallopeptidase n=1 Tax=Roseovarius aestuariivivens TaxID=1888910 RepID=UPI001080D53F|nr:Xaa-Pro peptidase family protein [Roseovarius aestuariivivens]